MNLHHCENFKSRKQEVLFQKKYGVLSYACLSHYYVSTDMEFVLCILQSMYIGY